MIWEGPGPDQVWSSSLVLRLRTRPLSISGSSRSSRCDATQAHGMLTCIACRHQLQHCVITWLLNSHTVLLFSSYHAPTCSGMLWLSLLNYFHQVHALKCSGMLWCSLSNHLYLSTLQTYSDYLCMFSLCHHFQFCGKTIVLLSSLHFSG